MSTNYRRPADTNPEIRSRFPERRISKQRRALILVIFGLSAGIISAAIVSVAKEDTETPTQVDPAEILAQATLEEQDCMQEQGAHDQPRNAEAVFEAAGICAAATLDAEPPLEYQLGITSAYLDQDVFIEFVAAEFND